MKKTADKIALKETASAKRYAKLRRQADREFIANPRTGKPYDSEVLMFAAAFRQVPEMWKGQCYALARATVNAKLAPKGSVAVYGHWTGKIAPGSFFAAKRGLSFCQHGWVVASDNTVIDPTRWVFEDVEPYIYRGKADFYDEGGNRFRAAQRGPPPEFDPTGGTKHITKEKLPESAAWKHLVALLNLEDFYGDRETDEIGVEQLRWLANAPYERLWPHAAAIYRMLDRVGMNAWIPIDNSRRAEREDR